LGHILKFIDKQTDRQLGHGDRHGQRDFRGSPFGPRSREILRLSGVRARSGTGAYSSDEQVFYAGTPTVFYDTQMTTPLWTAYPLDSSHMGSLSRPSGWSYNPNIDEKYQVRVTDGSYSNSTYSRGHMCPNGSRNGNATMQAQTFYVTNQVPQIQNSFNSGIWSNLENAVQGITKSHNEEIYVVTGVAFEKEGETRTINYTSPKSSSQRVPIPNYFYKLVLRVKYSGRTISNASCIAFWFDHKAYSDSYQNYTVSVDQVEAWTGFDFFVNLPDDLESAAESKTPTWSSFTSF